MRKDRNYEGSNWGRRSRKWGGKRTLHARDIWWTSKSRECRSHHSHHRYQLVQHQMWINQLYHLNRMEMHRMGHICQLLIFLTHQVAVGRAQINLNMRCTSWSIWLFRVYKPMLTVRHMPRPHVCITPRYSMCAIKCEARLHSNQKELEIRFSSMMSILLKTFCPHCPKSDSKKRSKLKNQGQRHHRFRKSKSAIRMTCLTR